MARTPTTQTAQEVKFDHIEAQLNKQEKHNESHFAMLEDKIDKLDIKLTAQITALTAQVTASATDLASVKGLLSNKWLLGGLVVITLLAGGALTTFAFINLDLFEQLQKAKDLAN